MIFYGIHKYFNTIQGKGNIEGTSFNLFRSSSKIANIDNEKKDTGKYMLTQWEYEEKRR